MGVVALVPFIVPDARSGTTRECHWGNQTPLP